MKRRPAVFTAGAALASCLMAQSVSAAVTPYSWLRAGESGITADSSGNNHPFNAAFSSGCDAGAGGGGLTAAITSPVAVGGPLDGIGAVSTVATRWGFFNCGNSGMWVQGPNNSVPPPEQWSLPATNWVMECWVLPVGTGGSKGHQTSQFMSTGSGQFGGKPGGARFWTQDNGDETITITAQSLGDNTSIIGDPIIVDKTRWVHVAVVNDNGSTTFYVDGKPSGAPNPNVTAPSGVPYIGSGQDTGGPFNGYLDELRYSTFAPGKFAVSDLLLRPAGPGFIRKPQNETVWDGGAAPFEVVTTFDTANTFQWRRGGLPIIGATGTEYILPVVAAADSGSAFNVVVSNNGTDTPTAPDAVLTVAPKQTANNAFYRGSITAESSLVAYYQVDGDTGTTLTSSKDASNKGTLVSADYDGRTDRSYGERALRFKGDGSVTIPNNPAFEFADGTGTIEALVYLGAAQRPGPKTIFSLATDSNAVYYQFQASEDGTALTYSNDAGNPAASWSVNPTLLGRLAHVAFVFTPGKVAAFVDGVALGAKDNPSFGSTTGLQANIGSSGTDGDGVAVAGWNGTIDELAIYGDALSDNAIAIHNSRFIYGTAVTAPTIDSAPSGTYSVLAGAAPIFRAKASGTAPLAYQWKLNGNPIQNNPTATSPTLVIQNSTVDSSGQYSVSVSNPIGDASSTPFSVTFTAPSPSDKYGSFVLADHPSGYWRLDETDGTFLKDSAGGLDGTYITGKVDLGVPGVDNMTGDKAAHFKAGGVSAKVPYSPNINPTTAYSIEFWAKPDRSGNIGRAVLGTQNRNAGRSGYAIYQGFNGNFWEGHIGFGESVLFLQGTTPPLAGRWDHVVVTWDGATSARLYVNGKLEGGATGGPHRNNLVQPLEIGSRFNGSVPYDGTIDEVAFYNYALTPEQIEHHFSIAYFASTIVKEPSDIVDGKEPNTLTLNAGVTGFPNTYQWFKDGVELDAAAANFDGTLHYPQGVTGTNLVIALSSPADSGNYRLVVTNPTGGSTTRNAAVTVAADTSAPTVVSVSSGVDLGHVRVTFSRPVTPETATVAANYAFTGGATVSSVAATGDLSVFDLVLSNPLTAGGAYSLTVTGVRDQRVGHNLIGANNTSFRANVLTPGVIAWDFYAHITGGVDGLLGDASYPGGYYSHASLSSFSTMEITGGDLNNKPAYGPLGDNYGDHTYGWLTPTVSGNYTFFLRSDDASRLQISSNADPANATQIAVENGCCQAFLEQNVDGTVLQTSSPIALTAGQSYFLEAFHVEGGGGDYVEVAWRLEGDTTPAASLKPIPASFFSAYAPVPDPKITGATLSGGSVVLTWTGGTGPFLLQGTTALGQPWVNLATTTERTITIPAVGPALFLRISDATTANIKLYRAALTGAAERPNPVTTTGSGAAFVSVDGLKLTYFVSYSGLSSAVTASHIHGSATVEQTAGVIVPFAANNSGFFGGVTTITQAQADMIAAGLTYVNVHTSKNGGGELRGQLLR